MTCATCKQEVRAEHVHVSPEQYRFIRELEVECHLPNGGFNEGQWIARLYDYFGIGPCGTYELIVVRR